MKAVGIVGHGSDKFTSAAEQRARELIYELLLDADSMVSGHSPVGGVDIWAEEEAAAAGVTLDLKIPTTMAWNPVSGYGFMQRNVSIAESATELHVILADSYPPNYGGRRFTLCYHCARFEGRPEHVKSGGCWTGNRALRLGKPATWHVIKNTP